MCVREKETMLKNKDEMLFFQFRFANMKITD